MAKNQSDCSFILSSKSFDIIFSTFLDSKGSPKPKNCLYRAWELASAVQYSGLEDREFLSTQLNELGDRVRDVKDSVIDLNAQGIQSFQWIVHEFSRLEDLITLQAAHPTRISQAELSKLVDSLFEKINSSLNSLLVSLDRTIPYATRASYHSRLLQNGLKREEAEKIREKGEMPLLDRWVSTVGAGTWKAGQLRRDLELVRVSEGSVREIWRGLEGTRDLLRGYQSGVAHFKAGVIGFHISGHGLSVEDEVASLRRIMDDFRSTVSEAKARGNPKKIEVTLPPA